MTLHRPLPAATMLLLAAVSLFTPACDDDTDYDALITGDDNIVRFEPKLHGDWNGLDTVASRAGADSVEVSTECESSPVAIIPLVGENCDTLYLHVYEAPNTTVPDYMEGEADSRGTITTTMPTSFNLFGTFYTTWPAAPSWIYNEECKASGTTYATTNKYFWPGSNFKARFYGIAPYNSSYTVSAKTKTDAPTLTYTLNTDVYKDQDILTAYSGEKAGNARTNVAMSFKHALAAIKFVEKKGLMKGRVRKLQIAGIYGKGVCTLGTNPTWSNQSTTTTFTLYLAHDVTGEADNTAITGSDNNFMVIPQKAPSGSKINVTIADYYTDASFDLTADISGTVWDANKIYTYQISSSSVAVTTGFTLTAPAAFDYKGGTKQYKIASYAKAVQGTSTTYKGLTWSAKFYDKADDGTYTKEISKPDWVTKFTTLTAGTNSETPASFDVTITHQTRPLNSSETALRGRAAYGSATAPYNLSSGTGGKAVTNTANCYIVSRTGTYCFPCVEGNKISGGKNNISKCVYYPTSQTGSSVALLRSGNGTKLMIPGVASAELLWEDVKGLITSVELIDGSYFTKTADADYTEDWASCKGVKFTTAAKDKILQGNAVIAVKNSNGTILWSWHIWVTNDIAGGTNQSITYSKGTRYIRALNLGWVDTCGTYAERRVRVILTQAKTGKTQSFFIVSNAAETTNAGYCMKYQWGRKDPFPPVTAYTKTGAVMKFGVTTYNRVAATVASPTTFCSPMTEADAPTGDFDDLPYWNTTISTQYMDAYTNVTKSVYDPCPPGNCVPIPALFYIWNGNFADVAKSKSDYGVYYYTNTSTKTNTTFLPCGGYLGGYNGQVSLMETGRGLYWTARCYTSKEAFEYPLHKAERFDFIPYSGYTMTGAYQKYLACSIRPMSEN